MNWFSFFFNELHKNDIRNLVFKINDRYSNNTIYPKHENILKAFLNTPFDKIKVVIVGQDPYHEEGQAQGLSFSVPKGTKLPPSLRNIFKEYVSDLNYDFPNNGDLSKWSSDGVLLINSILTVEKGKPLSHNFAEYKTLFYDTIKCISNYRSNVVFILWGSEAYKCEKYIDKSKNCIIKSAHPSPLSSYRGFFGSCPFSKTNEYLIKNHISPVNWKLE